jgi:hypothetical protein
MPEDNDMGLNLSANSRSTFARRKRSGVHQIFVAAFAMCLLAATVDLLLPRRLRLLPQPADGRKAFIDHVIEEANNVTAFAILN